MAVVVWPGSLPQVPTADGYDAVLENNTRTFQPRVGPEKTAPGFILGFMEATLSFQLSGAQKDTFYAFWRDTSINGANGGANEILIYDPISKTVKKFQIAKGERPRLSPVGSGFRWSLSMKGFVKP